ncbi:MAG: carboxypeptidase-like regulatory domain-containing protein, partial [Pyrinomonadaceae bacterium]
MTINGKQVGAAVLLATLCLSGCKPAGEANSAASAGANGVKTTASPAKPASDGTIPSGTGTEKEKPAAGTGNVQGRVLYNGQGAKGIEVKLCQTFSQYMDGCGGATFTTKTDDQGEYLIKNVPPGTYEGLTAKVFDTPYYVFATSGIVSAAKYKIEADKTYFAPDSNLFKSDLKLVSPKAGAKTGASNIEVKWDAYPDAAYYKFSINA